MSAKENLCCMEGESVESVSLAAASQNLVRVVVVVVAGGKDEAKAPKKLR